MQPRWEYCTVEWLWDTGGIRCNMPDGSETRASGDYAGIVDTLTNLGHAGWEVVDCVAGANWLFWTLKRQIT